MLCSKLQVLHLRERTLNPEVGDLMFDDSQFLYEQLAGFTSLTALDLSNSGLFAGESLHLKWGNVRKSTSCVFRSGS